MKKARSAKCEPDVPFTEIAVIHTVFAIIPML